jgi:hypothetical protein
MVLLALLLSYPLLFLLLLLVLVGEEVVGEVVLPACLGSGWKAAGGWCWRTDGWGLRSK